MSVARVYPLFSSSKGNATFFGSKKSGILIDVGVSFKKLTQAMHDCDLDISAIKGVFITHEHSDHVKGLKILTKNTGVTIYGQGKTLRALIDNDLIHSSSQILEVNSAVNVAGMEITAFDTPHDSTQSCGYRIKTEDGKICALCTDLGHVTKTVEENLHGCDLVLIEANYDEQMLSLGSYPPYVKNRIRSKYGHLSNKSCAEQIYKLIQTGTTRFILSHLSQENNTADIAEGVVASRLEQFQRNRDYILQTAPVQTKGQMVVF
jgi:phosphoribosyl 1,2-cyclic phosphodiesterase